MATTSIGATGVTFPNGSVQSVAASSGGQLQTQVFFSSGSWTAPTGVTRARVTVQGGGGGGATSYCISTAGGGQGGTMYAMVTVTPGTVYTVTVGGGGNGAGNACNGALATAAAGGTSSFGALASATGGTGGQARGNCPAFSTPGSIGSASTTGTALKQNQGSASMMFTYGSNLSSQSGTNATTTAYNPGQGGFSFASGLVYGQGGIGGVVVVEWVGP